VIFGCENQSGQIAFWDSKRAALESRASESRMEFPQGTGEVLSTKILLQNELRWLAFVAHD